MSRFSTAAATLVGLAVLSCESPTAPLGDGDRLPVDYVLSGEVTADTVRRYTFEVAQGDAYVIALEVSRGAAEVRALDVTGRARAFLWAQAPSLPLDESNTVFEAFTGGIYTLEVRTTTESPLARFLVRITRIGGGPEAAAIVVQAGDTVSGETLAPAHDFDVFTLQASAGQDVVAVVEPLGTGGSGIMLQVLDAAFIDQPIVWFQGAPASATTGRITIPASGSVRLRLTANSVGTPYQGAYRLWTYVIDRAPEQRAASLPAGTVVGDEALRPSGDVDEFTFTATAGEEVNLFFRAARAFRLELGRQNDAMRTLFNEPADTALFTQSTGRLRLDTAGTYTVRVRGPEAVADSGAYRLYLYRIDPAPEHVPAALTPGDTLTGEVVDLPGDVDEFTFAAAAGASYRVAFQATDGAPNTRLQAEVVDVGGVVLKTVYSAGNDTALLRQSSGLITAAATGSFTVRVSTAAFDPFARSSRGPFRLVVYPIDLAPETAPAVLALNDSVTNEALDVPGDIDEFTITVPAATAGNLLLDATLSPSGIALAARLFDGAGTEVASTVTTATTGVAGRFLLAPGTYRLRVQSDEYGDAPVLTGVYRVRLYAFSLAPETVPDTIAIGDTVSGEVIAPLGDVDTFVFHANRGDRLNFMVQGLGAASPRGIALHVLAPPQTTGPFVSVGSAVPAATLVGQQTGRVEIAVSGLHTVMIEGAGAYGSPAGESNAYRFAVIRAESPPEAVSPGLVIGDSVGVEAIDLPGDVDEFVLTGAAGQEFSVVFGTDVTCCAWPRLYVITSSGDSIGGEVGQSTRVAGPITMPADGRVRLEVLERSGGFGYQFAGPYLLQVVAVDRDPEGIPATYVVGDTVTEAIGSMGDWDEYAAAGTPGESLQFSSCLSAPAVPAGTGLTFHVIDPASGQILVGSGVTIIGAGCFPNGTSFTVPAGGAFLIRVRASPSIAYGTATAPYRFYVRR